MKVIKLIWILSMAAVMGVLLYEHVILQPPVVLKIDDVGGQYQLSKDEFFYLVLAITVLLNGMLLVLGTMIPKLPKQYLFIPRKSFWTSTTATRLLLLNNFKLWTKGLGIIINLFIIVYLLAVQVWNESIPPLMIDASVSATILLGLLIIWLVYFFVWFGYNKAAEERMTAKQ